MLKKHSSIRGRMEKDDEFKFKTCRTPYPMMQMFYQELSVFFPNTSLPCNWLY